LGKIVKIESIIRRAAGSTVILGSNTYRFLPGDDGRHVAEVEDEGHIEVLLANQSFRAVAKAPAGEQDTTIPEKKDSPEANPNGDPVAKKRGGRKAKAPAGEQDTGEEKTGSEG